MIEFEEHSDCRDCPMWASANNPGLRTRQLWAGEEHKRAVLFVGQVPGHQEDMAGRSYVGYTGKLLFSFIHACKMTDVADVYAANACRCKPPQGANLTQSCIRACRKWLIEDVAKLQAVYDDVIVMALGAKACYSTLHLSSLNAALKKQGVQSKVLVDGGDGPKVFSTYMLAILNPRKKPGLVHAVEAHFKLLMRYLRGEFIPNELQVEPEVGLFPPEKLPPKVVVDIETYGIMKGVEQTVFHPMKSLLVDGIAIGKQIITVSFAWKDGDRLRTALYIWSDRGHRERVRKWFRRIVFQKVTLIGQNLKFDLQYLANDSELRYWIDPRRLTIDDTLLMSFLLYEQQPEKGLKELSTLVGIADYSGVRVSGKSGNAKSVNDPDLHYYNCLDSAVTHVLYEEREKRIEERYGKGTPKLNATCKWVRNMVLWDVIDLETNGSTLNIDKLQAYHGREETRCRRLKAVAEGKYGIKLAGKGSDAPLRQLMLDCLTEADMVSDQRVEWSKKTGKISIGVENVNLVKPELPRGDNLTRLTYFQQYKEHSKIISTYTGPLLSNPRRGIVRRRPERIGTVYPSWYPVPSYPERGGSSDDKAGGQIQGRFSCKQPARQTEPTSIRKCSCSRWPGGKIVEYDVSGDHLRMAALLSGDPLLMEAFTTKGPSLHARTAATIFPGYDVNTIKKIEPVKYKVGKQLNFLVIFKGGADAFRAVVRNKVGIEINRDFAATAIWQWYQKYHVYKEWQDRMIALAAQQGYIVLPTGWSRTFGVGKDSAANQSAEICNFLHQAPCAQINQSSHYKFKHEQLNRRLKTVACLQIHDALFTDQYPGEEADVDSIMDDAMTHPPLLPVFERWVGRSIPWAYERKEYEN